MSTRQKGEKVGRKRLTSFDIQVISCKQVGHKQKYGTAIKQSDWLVLVIGLDWTNLVMS